MNNSKPINPFSFARVIRHLLILDGAMGSMLQQNGLKSDGPMWMSLANLNFPDIVYSIHKEYIDAGADIITTNTFRTNPVAVKRFGHNLNIKNIVNSAVSLALQAANDLPVFVAGSNAPAEDCYQRERKLSLAKIRYNHSEHIDLLMEAGCSFILNETQSHLEEIKIISQYCSIKSIPFIMSLFIDGNLRLLSGEKLFDVINIIQDYNPLAIGINCIKPETFLKFYKNCKMDFNWGVYLNAGAGSYRNKYISTGISPVEYAKLIKSLIAKNPSFIGGCCGTTPDHIKHIKNLYI